MLHFPSLAVYRVFFFFSSRRRHTRLVSDWSSDVCSSDLARERAAVEEQEVVRRRALPGREALPAEQESAAPAPVACNSDRTTPESSWQPREIGRASCRERG